MDPLAFTLVLVSAFLHAGWNALAKTGGDPQLRLALVAGASSLCALPLVALVGLPDAASWPYLACSVAFHQAYYALLMFAYDEGDLSSVYTIARGSAPVFVTAAAWWWTGEALSGLALTGILVVTLGIGILANREVLRCCGGRPATGAFLTALSIAAYSLSDGMGGRVAESTVAYAVGLSAVQGVPVACVVAFRRRRTLRKDLARHGPAGILAGFLSFLAYAVVIWAMSRAPLGHVAALREVGVVIAAVLGARALKEPFGARRIVAAAVVLVGVLLLQVGRAGH